MGGVVSCYHCGPAISYIDWHSGRFVESLKEVATRLPDLDDPDLEVPICAPLRRQPSGDPEAGAFNDSEYDRLPDLHGRSI